MVGDRTNLGKISKFERCKDSNILVYVKQNSWNGTYLLTENMVKICPLFKTEDGVDIYEGDVVYFEDESKVNYWSNITKCFNTKVKYFSTEAKAVEYINKNKKPAGIISVYTPELLGGFLKNVKGIDLPYNSYKKSLYAPHMIDIFYGEEKNMCNSVSVDMVELMAYIYSKIK